MERIIALDIGTVRIGVAVSDSLGSFAQPLTSLEAKGEWLEELASILDEYRASMILVGLPRRTDGSEGPETELVRRCEGKIIARFPDVELTEWDERFTSVIANQLLIGADVSRKGRKGKVDKIAASLILQSYLDSRTAR